MNPTPLAQRLRELRKACNYSQQRVADELHVIRQTYSHYETGRYVPNIETLYKLAALYHIPVDNLLKLALNPERKAPPKDASPSHDNDCRSSFLEYVNRPDNLRRFKNLTYREKELLYYFNQIPQQDQDDILDFLKIKAHRQ